VAEPAEQEGKQCGSGFVLEARHAGVTIRGRWFGWVRWAGADWGQIGGIYSPIDAKPQANHRQPGGSRDAQPQSIIGG
jgi:hypothetical protein